MVKVKYENSLWNCLWEELYVQKKVKETCIFLAYMRLFINYFVNLPLK